MSKDLGCVWQGMSADERAPFKAEALRRRKEYLVQMAQLANPRRHSRPLTLPSVPPVPLVDERVASNPPQGVIQDYTSCTSFDSSPRVAGPFLLWNLRPHSACVQPPRVYGLANLCSESTMHHISSIICSCTTCVSLVSHRSRKFSRRALPLIQSRPLQLSHG